MTSFVDKTSRSQAGKLQYPSSEILPHISKLDSKMAAALVNVIELESRLETLVQKKAKGGETLDDMEQLGIVAQDLTAQYRLTLGDHGDHNHLLKLSVDMTQAAMATAKQKMEVSK